MDVRLSSPVKFANESVNMIIRLPPMDVTLSSPVKLVTDVFTKPILGSTPTLRSPPMFVNMLNPLKFEKSSP